jgi:transposase
MRPNGSPEQLEARRLVAGRLLQKGLSPHEVAEAVGCTETSVIRWRDTVRRQGLSGLKAKPVPGRPPKLTKRQLQRLTTVLLQGARRRGHSTELWTTQRIADVILEEFGVSYHRDHVGRLMHRLKWSFQKPERRALERDEEKIERWKRVEWPRIKKGLSGWGPTSSS